MIWRVATIAALDDRMDDGTIEQKYLFAGAKKQLILDWLDFHLVRSPEFYFGPILSLYYDTPSFDLYGQVSDGDYLKNKVRLRWYQANFASPAQTVNCYLELKHKCGSIRKKCRTLVKLEAGCLAGNIFEDDAIASLPGQLPELRSLFRLPLMPMLVVEYQRYRFIDPQTGARVSLDTNIGCRRANASHLPVATPVELGCGVLEVKGKGDKLPESLRPLNRHLKKQSFSKYAKCCEYLMAPLLWREPA
jgi:hypothetical protein